MTLLKTATLALWLGTASYATAQITGNLSGWSCDPEQGNPCSLDLTCNSGLANDYECLALNAPNGSTCNPANHGNDCASNYCFNTHDSDLYWHGHPTCCAGPGDVTLENSIQYSCDLNGSFLYENLDGVLAMDYNGFGYCGSPSGWLRFDGGIYCLDPSNSRYVDAGSSPLATHGLMKANPGALDAGVRIAEPLGFYGWAGLIPYGTNGFESVLGPSYVCQMPWYNPDGGWTEADVGNGHADLMECGASDGPIYPCCGFERSKAGWADSCTADGSGINHCACFPDGEPCDIPRYLDHVSFGGAGPGSTGECCSPHSSTTIYTPTTYGFDGGNPDGGIYTAVIAQGQGWCHPTAAGITLDGSYTHAAGYCNCLPSGTACTANSDCCNFPTAQCISGTCGIPLP